MQTCASCQRVFADSFDACPYCRQSTHTLFAAGVLIVLGIIAATAFWSFLGPPTSPLPSKSAAQQQVSPPIEPEKLTTLLAECDPAGRIRCDDDMFKKVWLLIEADNGALFKVDTNFRKGSSGAVRAFVYSYEPNTMFQPNRLRMLLFDCAGHYMDVTSTASPEMDAPPRSVAGRIAALACSATTRTHHRQT